MASVTIKGVTKSFGKVTVLQEFNQKFEDGEFITLLGPSGCGKTTMLRLIAGFEKPSSGEIYIGDKLVSSENEFLPPEKRGIGMVFQSYAVWPHMNVFDNIAYPLKIQKIAKNEIEERVSQVLKIVHLDQYKDRFPSELSGGQQQRVALGRALVAQPEILLLDEPLSNLDAKLREEMRYEIKEITKKLKITVIYVTHDQIEAMTMSDRIVLINKGEVQQVAPPQEIYSNPKNMFVANFVGKVDFIKGKVENGKIYGVTGKNGKGKTLLLKILCGYSVLTKGSVYQDTVKLRNKFNFIKNAGIVIEKPDFIENYTLYDNLNTIKMLSDNKDINLDFWIEFYDLFEHKDKKYKDLSLGTKQKVLIIQAFMTNPDILILDECFNGLDEKSDYSEILPSLDEFKKIIEE